jgi:glycosyltransferase involved in cell wall biosynthesis
MKVLHVIPSMSSRSGGPGHAIIGMIGALQKRGLDILVASTDADIEKELKVELGQPATYKGVPAIFFAHQWSEAFKYSRPMSRWLKENVKAYDVVHIHGVFSHPCLMAARACRRDGVPYIVRPLGMLDPWSMGQKPFRKRLFWHLAVKQMLRGAAAIHYTAKPEMESAESSLKLERGVVIPLGVEMEPLPEAGPAQAFREQHPSLRSNPYVLLLSRLHPKKGVDLLLKAFLDLTREGRFGEWKLVLAGEGPESYVESLRRTVRLDGGPDRVLFPGWLEGVKKSSALQNASLLALPSHHENFGLCVMEALAYGVPVLISSYVNLAPEIEAAGVGWIVPLESVALQEQLADALGHEDERARRGRAGQEFARRYTWREIAIDLERLYGSLVQHRSASDSNGAGRDGKSASRL